MSLLSEFKEFAVKGSVIDLAVRFVIGGAFGKIVSSLVADVIMPPLGLLIGRVNFSSLAVLLKYGLFVQAIFEFLLIAIALFAVIKTINRLRRAAPAAPARRRRSPRSCRPSASAAAPRADCLTRPLRCSPASAAA